MADADDLVNWTVTMLDGAAAMIVAVDAQDCPSRPDDIDLRITVGGRPLQTPQTVTVTIPALKLYVWSQQNLLEYVRGKIALLRTGPAKLPLRNLGVARDRSR